MTRLAALLLALAVWQGAVVGALPSCEDDTAAHCLEDGADMSAEGIDACLAALGPAGRSESCSSYLRVVEGCAADLEGGGICAVAHQNGETIPCLMQRVKPEQLSAACQAALPQKVLSDSLADTFWKDGKRLLAEAEVEQLKGEDAETYERWAKRKSGAKTAKDKDRAYAVKAQKKSQATVVLTAQAQAAAEAALAAGEDAASAAEIAALDAAEKEIHSDLTGTLKSFAKAEIKEIVGNAVKAAKKAGARKGEL